MNVLLLHARLIAVNNVKSDVVVTELQSDEDGIYGFTVYPTINDCQAISIYEYQGIIQIIPMFEKYDQVLDSIENLISHLKTINLWNY